MRFFIYNFHLVMKNKLLKSKHCLKLVSYVLFGPHLMNDCLDIRKMLKLGSGKIQHKSFMIMQRFAFPIGLNLIMKQ